MKIQRIILAVGLIGILTTVGFGAVAEPWNEYDDETTPDYLIYDYDEQVTDDAQYIPYESSETESEYEEEHEETDAEEEGVR